MYQSLPSIYHNHHNNPNRHTEEFAMPHTGSQLNVEGTPVMIVKFVHRSLLVTAVAGASLLASSSVAGAATPQGAAPGTGVPVAGGFIDSLTGIGTGTVYGAGGAVGAIPYYVDYAPRGGRAMTLRRSPSGTILGLRHHPNRDRRQLRAQSQRPPPHRAYTIAVSACRSVGRTCSADDDHRRIGSDSISLARAVAW
jgi:hypothetical protein